MERYDAADDQHIGLGYLAAAVLQAGYAVKVLDAKLEHRNLRQTLRVIADYAPDILGLTAMTHQIDDAAAVAGKYKKIDPEVVTVIGGVHVTALPAETLRQYPMFDYGIAGEGEIAFMDLIAALAVDQKKRTNISGLVYRENGNVIANPPERISNLNRLPLPDWRIFPRMKTYNMITSRGCPYTCIFCMRALGQTVRARGLEEVMAEIRGVVRDVGPERIIFHDETFTKNRDRVYALCRRLIAEGIHRKVKWKVATRVDTVDRALLRIMRQAGCDYIEFGVESGNEQILQSLKKGITRAQAERAVKIAKELGYFVGCGFILGNPHETLATALETIDFAARLNPDLIQLGIMVPYPGTEVRKLALRGEGGYRMITSDWRHYNKQVGNALELASLSRKDLERLQLIGYVRLFLYNGRIIDFVKFMLAFRREMLSYFRNILLRRRAQKGKTGISLLAAVKYMLKR